ncbi:MAG: hypothetical protein H0T89_00080 [Deltaproteobacteria bacterium]|nr:hypothetical protein [Deltaproteobacteria bacterium]MDQ3295310.1 hypothetical protein [Myxococcota bacterium]
MTRVLRLAIFVSIILAGGVAHADAPSVPIDAAGATLADALAKVDRGAAKVGETTIIATVAPGDPAKPVDAAMLRAALGKRKLKILDEHPADIGQRLVIVVEATTGARGRIAVDPGGGTITLTARPSTAKPPGKCVAIPLVNHAVHVRSRGTDQRGERREGETFWDLATARIHDVDGDGLVDAFVPIAKRDACPEEVTYRVYAVRGSCGHDLGTLGPGSFAWDASTVALDTSGYRPFTLAAQKTAYGKRRIPEMTTTTRQFAVRKGRYTQVAIKRTKGTCHHCALWTCSSP